jgi:hypothetical protein
MGCSPFGVDARALIAHAARSAFDLSQFPAELAAWPAGLSAEESPPFRQGMRPEHGGGGAPDHVR